MLLLAHTKGDLVIWLRKIAAAAAFRLLSVLLYSWPTMKIYKCITPTASPPPRQRTRQHLAALQSTFASVKYSLVWHNSHKLG